MRRTLLFLFLSISLLQKLQAQEDFGYKTFDAGVSFRWNPDRLTYSLHLASNSKLYHSFIFHAGYTNLKSQSATDYSKKGNGWSVGAGYRYYFAVIPKRFFLGADVEYTQLTIKINSFGIPDQIKVHFVQPSLQTGYTIVINDQLFITPFGGVAFTVLGTNDYGYGLQGIAGISTGWRF